MKQPISSFRGAVDDVARGPWESSWSEDIDEMFILHRSLYSHLNLQLCEQLSHLPYEVFSMRGSELFLFLNFNLKL